MSIENTISPWTVLGMSIAMSACSGLGAVPFFFVERLSKWSAGMCHALACGVMLAASFDLIHEGQPYGAAYVLLGVLLGAIFIRRMKVWLDDQEEVTFYDLKGADARKTLLMVGIMAAHAFGEGMGVGVSFCGQRGWSQGLTVTIALAVHNVPEGLAVATVLIAKGAKVREAALWSFLTALPQALVALPSYLFVNYFQACLPIAVGFAAGCMIWMVFSELLPDAIEEAPPSDVATGATMAALVLEGVRMFVEALEPGSEAGEGAAVASASRSRGHGGSGWGGSGLPRDLVRPPAVLHAPVGVLELMGGAVLAYLPALVVTLGVSMALGLAQEVPPAVLLSVGAGAALGKGGIALFGALLKTGPFEPHRSVGVAISHARKLDFAELSNYYRTSQDYGLSIGHRTRGDFPSPLGGLGTLMWAGAGGAMAYLLARQVERGVRLRHGGSLDSSLLPLSGALTPADEESSTSYGGVHRYQVQGGALSNRRAGAASAGDDSLAPEACPGLPGPPVHFEGLEPQTPPPPGAFRPSPHPYDPMPAAGTAAVAAARWTPDAAGPASANGYPVGAGSRYANGNGYGNGTRGYANGNGHLNGNGHSTVDDTRGLSKSWGKSGLRGVAAYAASVLSPLSLQCSLLGAWLALDALSSGGLVVPALVRDIYRVRDVLAPEVLRAVGAGVALIGLASPWVVRTTARVAAIGAVAPLCLMAGGVASALGSYLTRGLPPVLRTQEEPWLMDAAGSYSNNDLLWALTLRWFDPSNTGARAEALLGGGAVCLASRLGLMLLRRWRHGVAVPVGLAAGAAVPVLCWVLSVGLCLGSPYCVESVGRRFDGGSSLDLQ